MQCFKFFQKVGILLFFQGNKVFDYIEYFDINQDRFPMFSMIQRSRGYESGGNTPEN